jgi:hypothetical protein
LTKLPSSRATLAHESGIVSVAALQATAAALSTVMYVEQSSALSVIKRASTVSVALSKHSHRERSAVVAVVVAVEVAVVVGVVNSHELNWPDLWASTAAFRLATVAEQLTVSI